MIDSLYRLAVGWNGQPPNLGACCFWLKNRRPSEWRDVQNIQADAGMYILSDKPMSESEWIEQRTIAEQKRLPKPIDDVTPGVTQASGASEKDKLYQFDQ